MQRRIGLTGGIASGKSTVGRWLEARGWPVLDADHFARDAIGPGQPQTLAVLERYGEVVAIDGCAINRAALGRIVFTDASERAWLEQLIHPVVRERFDQALDALEDEPVVVLMIPLLFEAGLTGLCSEIWLVDCDEQQQLARMMQRDGLDAVQARARLGAQWPLARKRPLADRLIDNRGTKQELEDQLSRCVLAPP
ncbi:MAG: dephospho-CoA kinase [Synechococcus sp. BS301-5m-G54]|jgi:dephospho-CoA kinase|uniref:dephospho-CoA kinase n=1 Tax=Synechococcus sp. A15-127 TaxID=1050624 RepID=UPI0016470F4F|nr:dephospho-CoA kinase [Synechococcus sp. A15-127]MBL6740170.1 dephospho-CoA kinase [Synechococcus sp. BS301-5m-G54]MBL6796414.1 dephospho-CoA kinase [Synechococcus sp. BS307-5m-G34]QNI95765.1 dephospho-CoA kinase [Synechococcus sp. A15-127]|tara:strand:+ start:1182 stop:1769 length:588 start_codon:yes stop_codon:yes gene_type:complete